MDSPTGQRELKDLIYDDWQECQYCGGTGESEGNCSCWDDTCCCLDPQWIACDHCNGKGGWHLNEGDG